MSKKILWVTKTSNKNFAYTKKFYKFNFYLFYREKICDKQMSKNCEILNHIINLDSPNIEIHR